MIENSFNFGSFFLATYHQRSDITDLYFVLVGENCFELSVTCDSPLVRGVHRSYIIAELSGAVCL